MIIVKNRELIIPREEFNIGTNYDTNTEVRSFTLPRVTTGGVDLASLSFKLDIKYANGGLDSSDLVKETTEDNIVLTWTITSSMLQVPGTVLIQLRATDEDGNVKWTSYQGATFVEDAINVPAHYEGSLSELEQLESRVTSVLEGESSRVAAEEARAEAEEGRVSAEEGRVSAEQSRVEAEQSRVDTEAQRVATFNANEAQRASTFATNEANRQSVAEGTESQRASTFAANEQGRIDTFNTNEADRENRVAALEQGYTQTTLMAKSYAVGGTGIRPGEDTDNAKYYKEQASSISIGSLGVTSEKLYFGDTKSGSAGGDASSVVALNSSGVARTYQLKDNEARTLAGNAQSAANAAQGTANTAVSNASAAQSTANTAVRNASTAQSTADTAVSNAAAAQSTANTALANAATAQGAANAAQATADGAVTAAGNAQALADQNAQIVSNDNLLDNPFFTVAQAGYGGNHASVKYAADRWLCNGANVSANANGGISISATSTGSTFIAQRLDPSEVDLFGKTVTFSANIDGTIHSKTVNLPQSDTVVNVDFVGGFKLTIGLRGASSHYIGFIASSTSEVMNIRSAKLEYGTISTLANDSIPPYAPTLLACQRYYRRLSVDMYPHYIGGTSANFSMAMPLNFRVKPTATVNASTMNKDGNGNVSHTLGTFSVGKNNSSLHFSVNATTSANYTAGRTFLQVDVSLSADL